MNRHITQSKQSHLYGVHPERRLALLDTFHVSTKLLGPHYPNTLMHLAHYCISNGLHDYPPLPWQHLAEAYEVFERLDPNDHPLAERDAALTASACALSMKRQGESGEFVELACGAYHSLCNVALAHEFDRARAAHAAAFCLLAKGERQDAKTFLALANRHLRTCKNDASTTDLGFENCGLADLARKGKR